MLKRLELWGFKSFADKTVFEFGPGITAIVGPNGSGKSNIVDAIRWVLGEQSAKSLRGKEMADCIFNGSGTRKQLGFAEVTVTVDNSRRYLRYDGEEVAITRRVYRTGESQYFINRKPARLRDIRDLLMGTGTSSQTYSIIEQGRVDALLQASNKERRLIFEEAAGIRAFKVRKQEALGRLEKVEQNLARLEDILEEVKRRLKTVRTQATRAREYTELSRRLKELRVQIGVVEYRRLQDEAAELEAAIAERSELHGRASARLELLRGEQLQLEQTLEEVERETRHAEAEYADIRQEIGRVESSIRHGRQRIGELQDELTHARSRWRDLVRRTRDLASRVRTLELQFVQETQAFEEHHRTVGEKEQQLATIDAELQDLERALAALRERRVELERQRAELRNRAAALESQARTMEAQRQRYAVRRSSVEAQLQDIEADLVGLRSRYEQALARENALAGQLGELESHRDALLQSLNELNERRNALSAHRAALERELGVYARLEEAGEGVEEGVRQILDAPELQPYVVGLLADLVEADREVAALVDRVLGSLTGAVVVTSVEDALRCVRERGFEPATPVTLIEAASRAPDADRGSKPIPPAGAVPLFSLIRPDARIAPVLESLLVDTWVVQSPDAIQSVRDAVPGARVVTRDGTLYEPYGAVTFGRCGEASGLVSRRAIVRDLRAEIDQTAAELETLEAQICSLQQEIQANRAQVEDLQGQLGSVREAVQQVERDLAQREQQRTSLVEEIDLLNQEDELLGSELTRIATEQEEVGAELDRIENQLQGVAQEAGDIERRCQEVLAKRENCREEIARERVRLAQEEERRRSLERELVAAREELADRERTRQQVWDHVLQLSLMLREAERGVLRATGRLAHLYDRKDRVAKQIVELMEKRDAVREERNRIAQETEQLRAEYEQHQQELHALELKLHDVRRTQQEMVDKLLEDYQLDLRASLHEVEVGEEFDLKEASAEARRLKRRIQSLGPVNVEAVHELEELEERERTLEEQRRDLLEAKQSLIAIIDRINEDSKRLFLQTLEQIRGHFQELFRKLFGGGRADIVLDDPDDVLESGVEIIAKPPGKELRSISLLSGGEKTLTVVALLLAIFRSRPSPFCILDEVDAALDEANIDRFTAVLREFTDQSQFILITHSKKTMLQADVLYGVTMQESGVSKRISVRLEDVNEQGEISEEALAREPQEEPQQEAAA